MPEGISSEHEAPGFNFRSIIAATLGNMLEFYDFITFSFFAIQVGHTFFPSDNQYASLMASLATFGAGFFTRPIGAIVIGAYSDRAGRRPAMILSFAMMGAAIITLSLIPSYATIGIAAPIIAIAARLVQGFALGGEVGPTTAYLMEAAPISKRGLVVAWQPASQQIAATAGATVGLILSETLSSDALQSYGWRIAFLIGVLTLPFGLWMRSNMPETIHLKEADTDHAHKAEETSAAQSNTRILTLGLLIVASGTIITYVTQYMTTYAEHTLHVAPTLAFATTVVANAVGIVAALGGGWLSDHLGRRPIMVWPQLVVLIITVPTFSWIVAAPSAAALLIGFGLLSLINTLPYSSFYAAFAEALPKTIRGGAFATIYALAVAGFGGTAQFVVTWLIHVTDNALAPAWYMMFASAVGLVAMFLMRETAPGKTGLVKAGSSAG